MGLTPPTPPAFNTSGEAFALLRMNRPAMPAPVTPEGVFGPMPQGGAIIGGDVAPQTPPSFPSLASSNDPGYPSGCYDSCTNYPGYPSGDYDSCPDNSGYPSSDYDFCSDNSGELGVNLPMPPPPPEEYTGVPTTPPMPRPAGVESPPPPPSPDARKYQIPWCWSVVSKWIKGRRLCLQPKWRLLH